jgi:hypothetical protein
LFIFYLLIFAQAGKIYGCAAEALHRLAASKII